GDAGAAGARGAGRLRRRHPGGRPGRGRGRGRGRRGAGRRRAAAGAGGPPLRRRRHGPLRPLVQLRAAQARGLHPSRRRPGPFPGRRRRRGSGAPPPARPGVPGGAAVAARARGGWLMNDLWISLVQSLILIVALLTVFAGMTLVERKLLGYFHLRVGPTRTGPWGLAQP